MANYKQKDMLQEGYTDKKAFEANYNQRVLGALNQQRMGQGYKYALPEDYLKEYSHDQIDSLIQANDLAQLLNPQPKDMEDDNSIMGFIQKLISR